MMSWASLGWLRMASIACEVIASVKLDKGHCNWHSCGHMPYRHHKKHGSLQPHRRAVPHLMHLSPALQIIRAGLTSCLFLKYFGVTMTCGRTVTARDSG